MHRKAVRGVRRARVGRSAAAMFMDAEAACSESDGESCQTMRVDCYSTSSKPFT